MMLQPPRLFRAIANFSSRSASLPASPAAVSSSRRPLPILPPPSGFLVGPALLLPFECPSQASRAVLPMECPSAVPAPARLPPSPAPCGSNTGIAAPMVDAGVEIGEGWDQTAIPLECVKQWQRIIKNQREALRGVINASRADCGPRGRHWLWYRDKQIKRKKKRRVI
eukprot:gnl/TRDRNA2_/TRDRNA2_189588_c0_seq1.p1 gnl/TRDRNA2_/TRDRNA2_189588_c0~~gnl/TRDRNA2_/TRDRNA2_189588_c0_seq1.p1  ORF type:complete len:168 (+),score=23.27 gnl/TRDRNA2_/TRDRNA2_189588_c0_seq1:68-571(+)